MSFGKDDDEEVVTESSPPEFLEDYLEDVTDWSWRAFRQPMESYSGTVVPEFAAPTLDAFGRYTDLADEYGELSPAFHTGLDTLTHAARGEGFDTPEFSEMRRYAVNRALPGVFGRAEMAGATGSPLAAAAASTAAMDAMAPLYAQERSNQLAAAGALPGYESTGYDIRSDTLQPILGIGSSMESRDRELLEEAASKEMFMESEEMQRILALMGGFSGMMGAGGETRVVRDDDTDWGSLALGTGLTAASFFL